MQGGWSYSDKADDEASDRKRQRFQIHFAKQLHEEGWESGIFCSLRQGKYWPFVSRPACCKAKAIWYMKSHQVQEHLGKCKPSAQKEDDAPAHLCLDKTPGDQGRGILQAVLHRGERPKVISLIRNILWDSKHWNCVHLLPMMMNVSAADQKEWLHMCSSQTNPMLTSPLGSWSCHCW